MARDTKNKKKEKKKKLFFLKLLLLLYFFRPPLFFFFVISEGKRVYPTLTSTLTMRRPTKHRPEPTCVSSGTADTHPSTGGRASSERGGAKGKRKQTMNDWISVYSMCVWGETCVRSIKKQQFGSCFFNAFFFFFLLHPKPCVVFSWSFFYFCQEIQTDRTKHSRERERDILERREDINVTHHMSKNEKQKKEKEKKYKKKVRKGNATVHNNERSVTSKWQRGRGRARSHGTHEQT